ncbi:MAG: guided entry of tail-anchored proteins factor 1 [Actinomycetota bacterium]|nr:guided entry of tail-anchored proteins factor 1 [Actinomycetota bacterium]
MSALVATLGCSLMMVLALAAVAWYAASSGKSSGDGNEVAALRAEIAQLRQDQAETSSDEFLGRR